MQKSSLKDLEELRQHEAEKLETKAELLQHNPLLHGANAPAADNENTPGLHSPEPESGLTLQSKTTDCASALIENLHDFQDTFGNVFATQRRLAELWMETWFSLFTPRMLNLGLPTNEQDRQNREATQASTLILGA